MPSRRTAKASRAVREVVSSAILFELNDPRVKGVTVLEAEVADDMRTAKVYVTVMGDEKIQRRCMQGLNSARGFLQQKIAARIDTRYTPVITFVLDQSVKKSVEAARILRELARERGELEEDEEFNEEEVSAEHSDSEQNELLSEDEST